MKNRQNYIQLKKQLDQDASRFISAETQLKDGIFRWLNQITSSELKSILGKYLNINQQSIKKIKLLFHDGELTSLSVTNCIIQAFIEETSEKLFDCEHPVSKDLCLLYNLLSINHYKINIYGNTIMLAEAIEAEDIADVLTGLQANERYINIRLLQFARDEFDLIPEDTLPIAM